MKNLIIAFFLLLTFISYGQDNTALPKNDVEAASTDVAATFPGCRGSNEFLKKCFLDKVREHLYKTFDTTILGLLKMPDGKHTIITQFRVNTKGKVRKIRAKGPHQEIEWEAIRALRSLPKMAPALKNGEPVETAYRIPMFLIMKDNKIVNAYEIN